MAEPGGIGRHPFQATGRSVHRPDLSLILHQLRQMGGLPPRGGTGIEDSISGLRSQQRCHPLGCPILNTPMALVIARPAAQITLVTLHLQSLGTTIDGMTADPCTRQGRHHLRPGRPQWIHPQIQGGHLIAGGCHGGCPLLPPPRQQQRRQPVRQRMLKGESGSPVGGCLQPLAGFPSPKSGAQHAVDHGSQTGQANGFRQIHSRVHCSGGGDALHPEELIQAHMQEPTQFGRLLCRRDLAQPVQPAIQAATPADRSVGQLRRQAAIGASQGVLPQGPFQGHIGVSPRRHRLQHLPGEPSWSQSFGLRLRQSLQPSGSRHSVRPPQPILQRQTALLIHRNPFRQQQLPLDPVAALAAEAHRNAPLSVHHPMPGHLRRQGQASQGPTHLPSAAIGTDQISDLAVGGQTAMGDARHRIPYARIKGDAVVHAPAAQTV